MKRMLLATLALGSTMCGLAQTDSTKSSSTSTPDTIRVGGMVIVRDGKGNQKGTRSVSFGNGRRNANGKFTSGGPVLDIGFANFTDRTNYASAEAQAIAPGGKDDLLRLRNGKSINVNIWFFMHRVSLVKRAVNLKYGLGIELNNYRFDDPQVHLTKNPTKVFSDATYSDVNKNKLAADYLTVPLMLNFNFTPGRNHPFGISAGASVGYLYSSRQKTRVGSKKSKVHDDFELEPWKLSWIGEVQLGQLHFYGSYAMKSMWRKGLDVTPYTVGIRLSRW
ncbi:porin family protein [Flaviaesturariibacter terrae]